MAGRSFLNGLINPWTIGGAILFALLLFGGCYGILWITRPAQPQAALTTAVINILPAPTDTAQPPTPTAESASDSPGDAPPAPPTGFIKAGMMVQVSGTAGQGLRLRNAPGLSSDILLVGSEGELFEAHEGPQEKDGFTWWLLVSPNDKNRQGWAVANYIVPVLNP